MCRSVEADSSSKSDRTWSRDEVDGASHEPGIRRRPVYMKEPLSLEGAAEEIYMRACRLSARMIECMIRLEPKPALQKGKVVKFSGESRKRARSEILRLWMTFTISFACLMPKGIRGHFFSIGDSVSNSVAPLFAMGASWPM